MAKNDTLLTNHPITTGVGIIKRANQGSEQIHVASAKRGKMSAGKSRDFAFTSNGTEMSS